MVSAWLFDPDGTVLEGPNGPVSHLICGGVYDWSTGLIYRGGRYFDPNLGIWLALMPLMVAQGWRKRKDKRKGVLLVCVGLLAVGMLAGCCTNQPIPTPTPTRTPSCTEDGSSGLGPGTGTSTPTPTPSPWLTPTPPPPTNTLPPPTDTPRPPGECVPVLPEPVGPLPTPADAQEAAKAAGAELDTPNKIPDLPEWQDFDRWVKNTRNKDVEIVSFMWGDYDNRDRAFVAIVWTIRNRVDIHYGEGGEYRFSSCSSITGCAQDNDYNAYAANRGYISSPYEEQVAMQVLMREREDPTGGAVFFRDTSMDPGCGKPFCVNNLEEMDPNVYEKLKHPAPRRFNFCPLCEENTGG